MTRLRAITAAAIALACTAGAAGVARASTLDPFRAAGHGADHGGPALDPFRRVAQALPAVPAEDDTTKAAPAKTQPATPAPATSAPRGGKPAPAPAPAIACQRDED